MATISNINDPNNNEIKRLSDSYIKSKNTKIIKYKKMASTTWKVQEIYVDLWRSLNPLLLSRKIFIGLLLNKFQKK